MSRARRTVFLAILGLAALGTAYTSVLAVSWALEAGETSRTVDDLSDTLQEESAALAELTVELEEKAEAAADGVEDLVDAVDEGAQSQDDVVMYGWAALGLALCVEAQTESLHYVMWWPDYGYYAVRQYDDEVDDFCLEIQGYYNDFLEEDA
jgi:hypothetical protein